MFLKLLLRFLLIDSREYEYFNHFPHIQLSLSATTSKNEGICHGCSEVKNDLVIAISV